MVSYVRGHQAGDEYVHGSTSSDGNIRARVRDCLRVFSFLTNLGAQQFCDLERTWTGHEARDQALFSSLGPSTCANLIKVCPWHTTRLKTNVVIGTAGVIH